MVFKPESCRNEREVISKLIVSYLLPQLGYSPENWHQEVKIANLHLDFLTLVVPVLPFVSNRIRPPCIIIEARHPKEKLARQSRKLKRYLTKLNARYGVLTNGKKLRIYQRNIDDELRFVLECSVGEITKKINDIRAVLGKEKLIDSTQVSITKSAGEAVNQETSDMKVIAIYHNKGGVGKTTVSVNLGASLSRKGKKVLLIDMDAQANTTFATGLIKFQFDEDDDIIDNYVYHLLESGDFNFIPDIVRRSDAFNTPELDVVPSHINLIEHQEKLNKIAVSRSRLIVKLNQVRDTYDIVIIDTPPSRDLYAEIPLIAADYLIIPSDMKPFANQGLKNVINFVRQINEYREAISRGPLVILGVLPSKISTNSQYLKHTFPRQKNVVPERYNLPLMDSIIYERLPLANALSYTKRDEGDIPDPKSIFDFCKLKPMSSAEQAAEDFESLTSEVMDKIQ
ncbi:MAG: AAA family ATPase [Thermodesulfobacteriota bacterium]|nr:AAA family ATPase [Thermodesulfobacteriota bacterium]